mmetsp:Transcript_41441/g.66654  ORF Transcript_41441/g.66654 Transcript_41441/m.66654 type:complete len:490 (-) Transcript_41441:210-1679(-)
MSSSSDSLTSPSSAALLDAARTYGTPLYVYDFDIIIKRYRELVEAFPNPAGLRIHYAMKANSNFSILQLMQTLHKDLAGQDDSKAAIPEMCIDCVSPGEVILAMKAGFDSSRLLYTSNNITDREMEIVHDQGVLFNIGSLSRLEKFGEKYPGESVCLRFNPNVVAGENEKVRTGGSKTKFGILLEDIKKVLDIVGKHRLRVVGVHEHTGSGIGSADAIITSVKQLLTVAKREYFPQLSFVDFGGGFKVPFRSSDKRTPIKDIGRKVCAELQRHFEQERQIHGDKAVRLQLRLEPGKWIIAESGSLLVTVNTVKWNKERRIAGTDSGFNHLIRPTLYNAYHHIRNLTADSSDTKPKRERCDVVYDICGNICETGDLFASDRKMKCEIHEGDVLSIDTAGAYGMTMGSIYNLRPLPAEALIRKPLEGNGKRCALIRKRRTFDDIAADVMADSVGQESARKANGRRGDDAGVCGGGIYGTLTSTDTPSCSVM